MVKGQNEPKYFAVEAGGILCTCLVGIKCNKSSDLDQSILVLCFMKNPFALQVAYSISPPCLAT